MKYRFIIFLLAVLNIDFCSGQNADSIRFVLDSANHQIPLSANILIVKNGQRFFEKSYGYADVEKHKILTANNSFQLASISKQFTAYGIMILKNKGIIAYDSLVVKYLPEFPYRNITIRNLLTHTSGLPNFWNDIRPNLDTLRSNGNNDVLQYLIKNQLPLQSLPGSRFEYCDIGYDFLATIIERLSGKSYEQFMRQNIFQPLKMNDTYAYLVTDIRRIRNNKLAIGNIWDPAKKRFLYAHLQPKYNFVFYLGDFYGDGSLVSTARDLAAWNQALTNCTLLPYEVQKESMTPYLYAGKPVNDKNGKPVNVGFGWFFFQTPKLGNVITHGGGHPGNQHNIFRIPDKNLTFIFLSNSESEDHQKLVDRILQLL
ncbi:serine hydrolase domain-containing protein [Dyadobacter subterraneus]|uniref:Beta-lactamase family protein n=1 Tax=Dyadobacter subterraneus TaxID=2773304 RepID=A0ABR9W7X7_9BACT|nr:serine hydrolase domain-containing protein [Dyadobacter subterraneus]MBE9461560.1 beta-lactamase family protein [Dyadobacter subterraneus]